VKALRRMLDRARPAFQEGGRRRRWKPVYDAADHFFFAAATRTDAGPHLRDPLDVKRYMATVIVALTPCVAASVYFFGLRVLLLILVSYAAGGVVEVLFAVVRKEEINEGFLVTGLLFPLVLPPNLPLWMAAVGIVFGTLVGKELFGGTGRNLFNPALVGRCFLALGYPAAMAGHWVTPGSGPLGRLTEFAGADAVTGATPLALARQGTYAPLPDLFLGHVSGSVGETSALAVLIGGVFLLATRVANWRTVAAVLGSFTALSTALWLGSAEGGSGSPWWHLLAGGILFGAFFMATDPITGPATSGGKWAYGILVGASTVLIRNFTGYVEGVMFAILLGNIAAPALDEVVVRLRLRRLAVEN
jgi:Na+-transporting NADH:ubiquinone oxidoreductase subunit B